MTKNPKSRKKDAMHERGRSRSKFAQKGNAAEPEQKEKAADTVKKPASEQKAEIMKKPASEQTADTVKHVQTPEKEPQTHEEDHVHRVPRSRKKGANCEPEDNNAPAEETENPADQALRRKKIRIACSAAAAVLALTATAYTVKAQTYRRVFFPKTIINGVDASGKTPEEVERAIEEDTHGFTLKLVEREGQTEEIAGSAISMHPEFDGSVAKLLAEQNIYRWILEAGTEKKHTIGTAIRYDEKTLRKMVDDLQCLDERTQKRPENAYVTDDSDGLGFCLAPAAKGTLADAEKLSAAVTDAILNLKPELDLNAEDLYVRPDIDDDNAALLSTIDQMNRAAHMTLSYRFGEETETLPGETIRTWLSAAEDGTMQVNEAEVANYVAQLAAKYDTVGHTRGFKTSYGTVVDVKGGNYGWKIDSAAETANLIADIAAGESKEKEPAYAKSGKTRLNAGIGDTYVEVNLTGQHLFYYKNGTLVLDTDFVSGNVSRGNRTPNGVYTVAYKQRNAVLKGANYRTPVSYWMPFNNGIGFHDANWRGAFGGAIYKTNGSHGCINMPVPMAKKLFETIEQGCVVVCYGADGTESKKTSRDGASIAAAQAAAEAASQAAAGASSQAAAETTAAANQNAASGAANAGKATGAAGSENRNSGSGIIGPGGSNAGAGTGTANGGSAAAATSAAGGNTTGSNTGATTGPNAHETAGQSSGSSAGPNAHETAAQSSGSSAGPNAHETANQSTGTSAGPNSRGIGNSGSGPVTGPGADPGIGSAVGPGA